MKPKRVKSARLTEEVRLLLRLCAEQLGISETAIIELALRRFAHRVLADGRELPLPHQGEPDE